MKRIYYLFVIALFAVCANVLLIACESNDFPKGKEIVLSRSEMAMVSQSNGFSFDLLNRMIEEHPDENVMLSPLSLSEVLVMVANGAAGNTREEILNTLGFAENSMEEVNAYYRTLHSGLLQADPRVKLSLANSVWIEDDFTVKQSFTETLSANYDAEVNVLPFDRNMVNKVNDWCARKTNGTISKFLEEEPDFQLLLLNALYFKGGWKEKFKKEKTLERTFYKPISNKRVDFMRGSFDALCYSSDDEPFKVLRLPYGNDAFSMIIALPDEGVNVDEFAKTITGDEWQRWIDGMEEYENVKVELPKFKMEFDFENDLKKVLQAMGIKEAFAATSDFSGINDDNRLYVGGVKQKTFIEVNEEGTTAAAVSGIIGYTSPGVSKYLEFIVNRPFIYAIQERSSGAILFVGKVTNPKE